MNIIEQQAWDWHVKHYGDGVDLPATYKKLLEEVGELGEALMRGPDERWAWQDARLEAGDVAVLLFIILKGLGCDTIVTAMAGVMDKLERRRHAAAEADEKEQSDAS